jgi:aquaglyceroporin related protein
MSDEKKSGPSSPAVSHDEHAKYLEVHNGEGSSSDSEHKYETKAYEEHGPGIDHHIPQDEVVQAEAELWWSKTRHFLREPLSEFFGVFILILFGDGWVLH